MFSNQTQKINGVAKSTHFTPYFVMYNFDFFSIGESNPVPLTICLISKQKITEDFI